MAKLDNVIEINKDTPVIEVNFNDLNINNPNEEQGDILVGKAELSKVLSWTKKSNKLINLYAEKAQLEYDFDELKASIKASHKIDMLRINNAIQDAIDEERASKYGGCSSQKSLLELLGEAPQEV